MSRTYYANSNKDLTFDINVSGKNILAFLHKEIGIGFSINPKDENQFPYVYSIFDEKLAIKCANILREKLKNKQSFVKLFNENKSEFYGNFEEFIDFIKEWTNFLENSKGCYVI